MKSNEESKMKIPYSKGIQVYSNSPFWIQDIYALFIRPIPRSIILGPGFISFFNKLNKKQWYKLTHIKKIKEKYLKNLIKHAYDNVPYYHKIFKEKNLFPDDIKSLKHLKKIPILTKNIVRNKFNELISINSKNFNYGLSSTSGSTGKKLTFLLDQQNREIEYASKWRQRYWGNIFLNNRIVNFRGNLGWRNFKPGKPYFKLNALTKELEFNILGMDRNIIEIYIEKLKKYKPDLIEGYPSALQLLGNFIIEYNVKNITPKAIQTSSETLSNSQRDIIEYAFNCKLFDYYSQSEYVVAAGTCPNKNYHIYESGIMEFIKDGETVGEGEIGEIIGTSLFNYSMPFIRYRLGDIGKYSDEKCNCGRGLETIYSLEGRLSDSIITPDGKIFTGMSFEHFWKHKINPYIPNIEYVHIIQKSKNNILIEMVQKKPYQNEDQNFILNELKILLGSDINIDFKNIDKIPVRTKWRFTESKLNINLI